MVRVLTETAGAAATRSSVTPDQQLSTTDHSTTTTITAPIKQYRTNNSLMSDNSQLL